MNILLEAAVACVVLVLIGWASWKLFDSPIAPPAFFSWVWAVSLGILGIWGGDYTFTWRAAALVCGVHLVFLAGAALPLLIAVGPFGASRRATTSSERAQRPSSPHDATGSRYGRLSVLVLLAGGLGLAGSVLMLQTIAGRYGSIAAMLSLADLVRSDFLSAGIAVSPAIRVLVTLNYPAAVLGGALLAIDPAKKGVAALPLAGIVVAGLAGFGRAGFVMGLSLYIASHLLARQAAGRALRGGHLLRTGAVVAAAGVVFFVAIQLARFQGLIPARELSGVLGAYLLNYSSGALAGLSAYLDLPSAPLWWGRAGFTAPLEVLTLLGVPLDTAFDHYYWAMPIGRSGLTINIFTFLRPIHEDFGWIGLPLFFFLLGLAGGFLFVFGVDRGSRSAGFVLAGVYGYLVYGLITSAAIYMSWLLAIALPAALYWAAGLLLPGGADAEGA